MRNQLIALASASAMAMVSANSHAQTVDEAAPRPTVEAAEMPGDEIVVTALKRNLSLAETPASVSSLDAEALAQRGITSVAGLAAVVPNLRYEEYAGATFVTIRGVGASVDTGLAEPSVATYVDGVFLPRSTMAKIDLIDLGRVDVLRGPQGTLYGRNASGGAINFIPQAPSDHLTARLEIGASNYDGRRVAGFASGPLADTVRVRVSATRDIREGYVRNEYLHENYANLDQYSVRGALRFVPSTEVTIDLSAYYSASDARDAVQQGIIYNRASFAPSVVLTEEPWHVTSDIGTRGYSNTLILAGKAEWKISSELSLRYTGGYVDHDHSTTVDSEGTSDPRIFLRDWTRNSNSISQELNLIGSLPGLDFVLGGYYFHEHYNTNLPVVFGGAVALPAGTVNLRGFDQTTESFAFFADVTYTIVPGLRLNLGGRYNHETSRLLQTAGLISAAGVFTGQKEVPGQLPTSSRFLPKVGIQVDIGKDSIAWAQFQKSIKSGGPNLGLINTLQFAPEEIESYELGLRSQFADRRVSLMASAFYYKYRNLQVFNTPPDSPVSRIESADARIYGAEAELNLRPFPLTELHLAATVTDAKYTQFIGVDAFRPALGGIDLKGNRLNRVAPYSFNVGAKITVPLRGVLAGSLILSGDALFSGPVYFRPFNLPQDRQPAYAQVNINATLLSADERWSLRAYANNLFNAAVRTNTLYNAAAGGFIGAYGPPRIYGLTLAASIK